MTTAPAADAHPAPPEQPERPGSPPATGLTSPWPAWPGWTAPAALLAGFAAALVAALLIGGVGAVFGAEHRRPAGLGQHPVGHRAGRLPDRRGAASSRASSRRRGPRSSGCNPAPLKRSVLYVVGGYVALHRRSASLWLAIIGQPDAKDTITEDLGAKDSTVALIAVTFVVTVCAPLAEEFFFRGYFFGALRKNGFWFAALFTGLAFGTVHVFGSPIAFIVPLAALGTALCFIREKTGSLYPGIALHCINNSVAMSSSEHWSWQVPVVLVLAPAAIAALIWLGLRLWPVAPVPAMTAPAPSP